jgi:hypothetical protein
MSALPTQGEIAMNMILAEDLANRILDITSEADLGEIFEAQGIILRVATTSYAADEYQADDRVVEAALVRAIRAIEDLEQEIAKKRVILRTFTKCKENRNDHR